MRTSLIPQKPVYFGKQDVLDYKAICVFSALGFFLDTDTFWTNKSSLPAATDFELDEKGKVISSRLYFSWHYEPRDLKLAQATDEFADLFERIVFEQSKNLKVILPLSGGLDSRTQAAALKIVGAEVSSYSYSFSDGLDETQFAQRIAKAQEFPFLRFTINSGYLWDVVDNLAKINECYSEFTHPRQMAFIDDYEKLGDVFNLGHWGDVLFDDMGVSDDLPFDDQVTVVLKKVVKKGGLELASALWKAWGYEGNFEEYLYERIRALHGAIDIQSSANARIRAFKSMYWAPRWTSVNLSIFESIKPISLPYYDNRMCEFICTIPEKHLAGRKIQIEYLKRRAPELANITWQDQRPFNLYNYDWNKVPWNLPNRILVKAKRVLNRKKHIQRNWELQFLGEENEKKLKERLFKEPKLTEWIPRELIREFYRKFQTEDPVYYSHSVAMLLTLSLFSKYFKN